MANSRYEYVKDFETQSKLLPKCWIVVRIDGRAFHRLTSKYAFTKPNDLRGLGLMNAAASAVLKEIPDICLAYGISDEYSFVFERDTTMFERREAKLVTTITSMFTSYYTGLWAEFFPERRLTPPFPSFDGRAVVYPNVGVLRDYMSWRQVDCHINNLYNTAFWALVLKGGLTEGRAEEELRGTVAAEKNEILFSRFEVNYNDEPEMFRKGSILYRQYEDGEAVKAMEATQKSNGLSKTQQEKQKKRKSKASIKLVHVDLIQDEFWKERPWILGTT